MSNIDVDNRVSERKLSIKITLKGVIAGFLLNKVRKIFHECQVKGYANKTVQL